MNRKLHLIRKICFGILIFAGLFLSSLSSFSQITLDQLIAIAESKDSADYTVPSFTELKRRWTAAVNNSSPLNLNLFETSLNNLKDKNMPYNIVMNFHGDPKTRMAFNWFTNANITGGKVEIVVGKVTNHSTFNTQPKISVSANTSQQVNLNYNVFNNGLENEASIPADSKRSYTENKALATGLIPNTTYSFRVGKDNYWSDIGTFTTAKTDKSPFSFIYTTDPQAQTYGDFDKAQTTTHAAFEKYKNVDFWMNCGDLVETSNYGLEPNSEWEWEQLIETQQDIFLKVPFAPVIGNHDVAHIYNNFRCHFNTENFVTDNTGSTYTFTYGDAQFFALNGELWYDTAYINAAKSWMRAQVRSDIKWRIAYYHKGIYTGGSTHQSANASKIWRDSIAPLFDELGIDLAIQGHNHVYEVIGPVKNKKIVQGAVSNIQDVPVDTIKNLTGKSGGIFDVREGTLYFLNNCSGNKLHYSPNQFNNMPDSINSGVPDYPSLFSGRLGQNKNPTYSHISVLTDSIIITTYEIVNGNSVLLDKICIDKSVCSPYTHEALTYTNSQYISGANYVIRDSLKITGNTTIGFSNSTLRFYRNAKIIIEPGGKLILSNTTLTSACDRMWQGIIMKDNSAQPSSVQGYVELLNNSKIENAVCGITVHSNTVYAENSQFINNKLGVKFESLASGQTGASGTFSGVTFVLDNNYLGNTASFEAHLKMENSSQVMVRSCTFSSTKSLGASRGIVVSNTPNVWYGTNQLFSVPLFIHTGTNLNNAGNINIQANSTFTNMGVVRSNGNAQINVCPGGALIINGGILTGTNSNTMWHGITLTGDSTQSVTSLSQSSVTVRSNGKIENAAIGIHATKGGRVRTENAYFANNTIAVKIDPVATTQTGSSAIFTNTNFLIDDGYLGNVSDFEAHVKLFGCNEVLVVGCTLLNATTPTTGYGTGNNNGIWAFNAPLTVKEYCPVHGSVNLITGICVLNDRTPNFFSGFTKAIAASNSGTTPTLKVRCSKFSSNSCGIEITGINNHELILNDFFINSGNAVGVSVSNATGYKIEENTFTDNKPNFNRTTTGLSISNSGTAENEVYKNTFNGLYAGQQFLCENAWASMFPLPGLQTLCNIFNNNRFRDIHVGDLSPRISCPKHLIRQNQGNNQKPAGNIFNGTPVLNIDNALSNHVMNYYYHGSCPSSVVNVNCISATAPNSCPSKIGTGGGQQTKGGENIEQLLAQYDEWNAMYEYWLAQFLAFEGDEGEEYDMLLNNVSYYSALKDNYFNWVVVSAYGEGEEEKGEKEKGLYENLRFLFAYRGHYIDYLSITETHLAENNYEETLAILAKMYKQFEVTEEQVMELKGLEIYTHWLQQLEKEEKTIYNLPDNEIKHLVNYVETNTGRGRVFANNILCGLYGICVEDEVGGVWYEVGGDDDEMMWGLDDEMINNLRESVSSASSACQKKLEKITLYPNPTTGELEIKNYELEIKSIEVFDVYGRTVGVNLRVHPNPEPENKINISHLPAGVYFVKITTDDGEVIKKIIKQ